MPENFRIRLNQYIQNLFHRAEFPYLSVINTYQNSVLSIYALFFHISRDIYTRTISQISRGYNLEDISFPQGAGKLAKNILFRNMSSCMSWSESKEATCRVLRIKGFSWGIVYRFLKCFELQIGLIFDAGRAD